MESSQKGIPQENRSNGHRSQFGKLSLRVRKVFAQSEDRNRPQRGEESPPQGGVGAQLSKATAVLTSGGQLSCSKQEAGLETSKRSFQPAF